MRSSDGGAEPDGIGWTAGRTGSARDHEVDESALAARANRGDSDAISTYFAARRRSLRGAAARLAPAHIESDDLVSEAITAVIARWRQGEGPTDAITPYVVAIMRNRVIDELRSPRSRSVPLRDDVPTAERDPRLGWAELDSERSLVRRTLATLPTDQRLVLLATAVDGRRPRDLVSEFGRPPAAISALAHRARLRFRRALLSESISSTGARPGCLSLVHSIPDPVGPSSITFVPALAAHVGECRLCAAGWGLYRELTALEVA